MTLLQTIQEKPIQELWKESHIAISEIEVPAGSIVMDDPYRDIANFAIIMALVIYLIFAHRRIVAGVKDVIAATISTKRLISIEKQNNMQVCRNTLFIFLTLCSSFVFANIAYATRIIGYRYTVPVKFVGIFCVIMLYFFLRKISLHFLAWLNNNSLFRFADNFGHTFCCLWHIIILCCFFVIKSIPSAPMGTMRYCIIFSTLTVFVPYFYALYRIFMQKGISHFFYILYLCTLEILPIAVLLHLNFS